MSSQKNFYSVIIGTELLNGRRKDAHFSFLNEELLKRGWTHKASFVIEDDVNLMANIFTLIKEDKDSVMFCYGGIGATPDDYTRKIAANIFRDDKMEFHEEAKQRIVNQFGDEAYPHRINMAYFPINASLLKNVVNNVAGFYLDNRFFFTPGFPSMSKSMVIEALDSHYKQNTKEKYRLTLTARCGENDLINAMRKVKKSVELSSLPKIFKDKRMVVLSLSSYDKKQLDEEFGNIIKYLEAENIYFEEKDIFI